MAANAKGFEIHPAAAIFRTVLLNEISEENGSLMKDVERLQPLLNHLQKVEVIAHAVDEERHPGQLTLVKQTISGLKLSGGNSVYFIREKYIRTTQPLKQGVSFKV